MADRIVPGTGFMRAFYDLAQDGWKDGFDTNILLLSVLTCGRVISRTTALPAGSDGDIYIVRSDAGLNANSLAVKDNGAYVYFAPGLLNRWRFYVEDAGAFYYWQGASWVPETAGTVQPSYPVQWVMVDGPESDENFGWIMFTEEVAFSAGLVDFDIYIGTPPTAGYAYTIQRRPKLHSNSDGEIDNVGTINIAAGAEVATTGFSGPTSFLRGEMIRLLGQTAIDATLGDVTIAATGVRAA